MSFDLAVWWADRPLPSSEAQTIYEALCEEQAPPLVVRPELGAFVAALAERIPLDLEREDAPWSDKPTTTSTHALFCIQHSHARRVVPVVKELARGHGLVAFDPQRGVIEWPATLEAIPHARLSDCNGRTIDEPSASELRDFLTEIGGENRFAVLERTDTRYVQAAFGPNARVSDPGAWQVEVRDGGPERHFGRDATFDDVVATFAAIQHDAPWELGAPWRPIRTT